MNKIIPVAIMLVMVLMLGISWYNVSNYKSSLNAEYNMHINAAEEYEEKEIFIDAVKEYEAALKVRPTDYNVAMKIVDLYDKLDDRTSYMKACQNAIEAAPTEAQPYILLADCYSEKLNYNKAYETLHLGESNVDDSSEIKTMIMELKSRYDLLTMEYDTFDGWHFSDDGSIGYARVSKEGKYGLLKADNRLTIKCDYEDVGLLTDDLMPIKSGGEYYYVTEKGYRKLVTDHPAQYLGCFSEGYAAALINGKWGYIDKKAKEYNFEYDYAGAFANGVAAVKKNDKWALINKSFKTVDDFELDDVILDEYGFCSVYGVIWGKQNGKYYLYNTDGECVSAAYDDVKKFASDEPAAVKVENKWGFVSKEGELVVEPTYENADSFSLGYAPFYEDGKWGCIDEENHILIEPTFDSMSPFYKNGYSLVEVDEIKKWVLVSIYE